MHAFQLGVVNLLAGAAVGRGGVAKSMSSALIIACGVVALLACAILGRSGMAKSMACACILVRSIVNLLVGAAVGRSGVAESMPSAFLHLVSWLCCPAQYVGEAAWLKAWPGGDGG